MTNATWKRHPSSGDYNLAANWSAAVPDGKATFGASSIHALTFSLTDNSVGEWSFTAQAANYTFTLADGQDFDFTGAGIVIAGGAATIENAGDLNFHNGSTAGKSHIVDSNTLDFFDSSSAGKAHITDNLDAAFHGQSSAGSAHIAVGTSLAFYDSSTAGKATITNSHQVFFFDGSTAGSAHITNDFQLYFSDTSTAGHAVITNGGTMSFAGQANAGNAVITTEDGALLEFEDSSDGGEARLITEAGGHVQFADDDFHVGSIEGAGDYDIADYLVITSNRSTKVSGSISGGGTIVKDGTGTLTLSHQENAFSLTELSSGTLAVAAIGAGGEEIDFTGSHATLKIENSALSKNSPSNHVFNTTVVEFGNNGNKIDFAGLKFVVHAKANFDTNTGILSVKSGKATDTIYLSNPHATTFKAVSDGHGGTKVIVTRPDMEKSDGSLSAGSHQGERGDAHLDFHQEIAHHDFIL